MTTTPNEIPEQTTTKNREPFVSAEVGAIQNIWKLLAPFDWSARNRILQFVGSLSADKFTIEVKGKSHGQDDDGRGHTHIG